MVRDDDKIYVVGGLDGAKGALLSTMEIYDPKRSSGAPFSIPRGFSAQAFYATLLRGNRILACQFPSCYVYLPDVQRWEEHTDIHGNFTPLVTLLDGQVLMAGGLAGVFSTSSSYTIDPTTLKAEATGNMPIFGYTRFMVRLRDGRVLAAGVGQVNTSAVVFDPSTRLWTSVAPLQSTSQGSLEGVLLPDGTALAANYASEVYDPQGNKWTSVPGLSAPASSRITLLPNGQVLITGGEDGAGKVLATTTLFDPVTKAVRMGKPMEIPRENHGIAVLHDGTVLAIGGTTTGGVATASVERIAWEPSTAATLNPGFYVATASQNQDNDDGFWGIEVHSSGVLDGGLNFGGLLAGTGKEVGFGAFYIAEAQAVTATVNLQALPGTSGPLEFTLNVLDVNKKQVAGPIQGVGNLTWSQTLQPGFYDLELRSSDRAPDASFQMALTAPRLQAGGSAGASLQASAGVTGFVGFYLATKQDVTINLYNEQTYGYPRGAGSVILTLYDPTGKVIQRVGPGATPP